MPLLRPAGLTPPPQPNNPGVGRRTVLRPVRSSYWRVGVKGLLIIARNILTSLGVVLGTVLLSVQQPPGSETF